LQAANAQCGWDLQLEEVNMKSVFNTFSKQHTDAGKYKGKHNISVTQNDTKSAMEIGAKNLSFNQKR